MSKITAKLKKCYGNGRPESAQEGMRRKQRLPRRYGTGKDGLLLKWTLIFAIVIINYRFFCIFVIWIYVLGSH